MSKCANKQKRQKQQTIIEGINKLCWKQDSSLDEQLQLNNFQSQCDKLLLEKTNGAYVRSRAGWMEEGEKNFSYIFNLEKHWKEESITGYWGDLTEDQDKVNEETLQFCSNLYKSNYSAANGTVFPESLRGFIGTLDESVKDHMKGKLATEALDKAVEQIPKSAGTDGLMVEFYSFFWDHIRSLLYSAYLQCTSSTNLSPTCWLHVVSYSQIFIQGITRDWFFIRMWLRSVQFLLNYLVSINRFFTPGKWFLHNFSPHMLRMWNNRLKPLTESYYWSETGLSGILFVTDLLDSNGALLDFVSFLKRNNLDCPLKHYRKACHAIPLALKQLICNTLLYSDVKPALPSLKMGNCNLNDSKCNNKFISVNFKSIPFHEFDLGRRLQAFTGISHSWKKRFRNLLSGLFPQKLNKPILR